MLKNFKKISEKKEKYVVILASVYDWVKKQRCTCLGKTQFALPLIIILDIFQIVCHSSHKKSYIDNWTFCGSWKAWFVIRTRGIVKLINTLSEEFREPIQIKMTARKSVIFFNWKLCGFILVQKMYHYRSSSCKN